MTKGVRKAGMPLLFPALTLPWPCPDPALTLPWPCPAVACPHSPLSASSNMALDSGWMRLLLGRSPITRLAASRRDTAKQTVRHT